MNNALNMRRTTLLIRNIKLKGLEKQFHDHLSYFYRLYRKNIITEAEYKKAYDSTLLSLGQ